MKKIKTFLIALLAIGVFCACSSNVGKFCKPLGNTPCPVTKTLTDLDALIDAAKRYDNAETMRMMARGEALLLDVTISYRIVEEGSYWYVIEADGKKLYVARHMVKVE